MDSRAKGACSLGGRRMTDDLREAIYRDALGAVLKIYDPDYRAGAVDGLITRRLRNERAQPDSALAMRLRREAHEMGVAISV